MYLPADKLILIAILMGSGMAALPVVTRALPQSEATKPSYAEITQSSTRQDGLLTLFVDDEKGRVLLALPAPDDQGLSARVIHHTALRTGVGSAVTGLDRAQIGRTHVLVFRRIGRTVVAEFENSGYRAASGSVDEQAAARDAFVGSTVWSTDILATAADGSLLIDIGGFLTRDAHGIAESLKASGQGTLRPLVDLSLVDPAQAKAFPKNIEMEARLSFSVDTPGQVLRQIAPDARIVTFTVHHSFIKLPEAGYQTRAFDPRTGAINTIVTDFSVPLTSPVVTRLANRFRLEKIDRDAARSTVVEPIVFYVDRAAPEPLRTALVEGAMWWAEAFERAGYIDAFRVETLPEGVDPLDARYNVINWVNRATRSWSYGQSVVDPRTGEIIKGSVLLGSLRVRQDMLIFEGLVGVDETGSGSVNDPQRIALDRIRQLSAHEVGHAIGLLHNFAGSTQDRSSVMDYPVPLIQITEQGLDFSEAYGVGVGKWDRFAIDWLYSDADQAARTARADEVTAGLRFVSDADSRDAGDGQPWGSLWDNGADPVAELYHVMRVRRMAMDRFGVANLRRGEAVNELRRKLVPVYLFHRYQVDAAAKLIGGIDYGYPVAGAGQERASFVVDADQRRALAGLIATLDPAQLILSDDLTALLAAQQSGDGDPQFDIEVMRGQTGRVFDPEAAVDVAADVTLDALFAAQRVNRLAQVQAADAGRLGLGEVIDQTLNAVFETRAGEAGNAARRIQVRTVLALAGRTRESGVSSSATAIIAQRLEALADRLSRSWASDGVQKAHDMWLASLIADRKRMDTLLEDNRFQKLTPPGSPIGAEACWHC